MMRAKKTLRKKHRIKKKKPLLENNFIGAVVLSFFLLCGTLYFFVLHPLFQVDAVTVLNAKSLKEETIHNFIHDRASVKFLIFDSRSIFLLPIYEIREEVLKESSVIKDISIKRVFPAQVEVEIKERNPFAIWCPSTDSDNCYYIDEEGVVFQKVDTISKRFFLFVKEDEVVLGKKILDNNCLEAVSFAEKELPKIGIAVKYSQIPTEKMIKTFTEEGWQVHFSVNQIEREVANLKIILGEINDHQRKNLKYIDLRFGDRIYYK